MFALKETNMTTNLRPKTNPAENGFTLLELMVALVVTLVITGSMWGLMASGQGSFRREPALMDRQQQIRIAMTRIREDIQSAGLGLGNFFQSFVENTNAVGVAGAVGVAQTGVRPAGDPLLGGGLPDFIEIRSIDSDCPLVRVDQFGGLNGNRFDVLDPYPACYQAPTYVLALYNSGAAKWGVVSHTPAGNSFNFSVNENSPASGTQMRPSNNFECDIFLPNPPDVCPLPNRTGPPERFVKMNRIRYGLGLDVDGTPSLFRSSTGGYDNVSGAYNTLPPGDAWQLVARGIEDLQIRYRVVDAAGNPVWQDNAPTIVPPSFDNVVREVEITMWARTVGENLLQGQSQALGNGVTAVRGSLVSSVAPRAAQIALMQELDPAKRWQ
jgi:prepilin-type N-terminal cleavage/methylation domain-containing protein